MKVRHAYITRDFATARLSVDAARRTGVPTADIALVAATAQESERIPQQLKETSSTDFVPAALRGALIGAVTGLLLGLGAFALQVESVTLGVAAFLAALGAGIGGFSSALVGAAMPSTIRRMVDAKLRPGELMMVVDAEPSVLDRIEPKVQALGAEKVSYERLSALS